MSSRHRHRHRHRHHVREEEEETKKKRTTTTKTKLEYTIEKLPRKPTQIFPVRERVFAFESVRRDARKCVVRLLDEKIFTRERNRGSDGVFETDRTSFDEDKEERGRGGFES